jgi:hypothetical protein
MPDMLTALVFGIGVAPAVLLLPLAFWARWLRRRGDVPRFITTAAIAQILLGALITILAAALAFSATKTATDDDPTAPARALAEGISEAMNCGALAVLFALAAALWLAFGTWRWRRNN